MSGPEPTRRATPGEPLDRETNRWLGVNALALAAGSVGVLLSRPALVLAAVLGVAFGAYARAGGPPDARVSLSREISETVSRPGESVRVTVTVRNEGDSLLPDLRVVDGVPEGLTVVEGSPRHATALRPGKAAAFTYEVRAVRGHHTFAPATVLVHGFSGSVERELAVRAETPTTLDCTPELVVGDSLPLRTQTTPFTGRVVTDTGGPGTEFHSVREYRPGDPLSRIDWRRAARTGEYATLQFRPERAATVALVVDTREEAYRAPDPDSPSAVERSVTAAGEAFTSLLATGDRVALAAYGPAEFWLPPGAGDEHRASAREALGTHRAFAPTPGDDPFFPGIRLRRLRRRLPGDAQVVLFTPLADDYVVNVARRLDAYGHLVTVVSPDPTAGRSDGQRLARVERSLRASTLRAAGIRVVDWPPDRPLAAAVARARRRWST
ncbi:DUF58 domain-containing protein [Salinirubellus salinus]|jgi:uncharacterized repeat protein (TIGR01451 family)|uniref:DUF58 domain-containing protein n=1 Tax=Salinirubellus salinus TaxID=1364945 RepID=A0A9E7UBB5_9EURY|nr:DUF58 domain-containing protein [Salinirubellus salinus]UWM54649.1 DUF58 domain-containing protein [Salinirubellus salinus]